MFRVRDDQIDNSASFSAKNYIFEIQIVPSRWSALGARAQCAALKAGFVQCTINRMTIAYISNNGFNLVVSTRISIRIRAIVISDERIGREER